MTGQPIWQAYAETAALDIECPNCWAPAGVWCTKSDGRVARVPCLARAGTAEEIPAYEKTFGRDFSEPIHQPEGTA